MSIFMGEMLGTATLIVLGDGVVAGVLLKQSKAENAGWIVITAGWAFAVLCGIFVAAACGSPAAYINPAFAIGITLGHGGSWVNIPQAVAGDFVGAFLGGVIVFLQYLPHWKGTDDQGLKLAVFCTGPAIRNLPANLISEIIGTFVLTFVIGAIFSKAGSPGGIGAGFGPYLVASLVWGIGLSLGGTTGYAINPARDLGPRIAHALLPIPGKGSSDWGYAAVPVVGPVIGAVLAGSAILAFGM
jgi:glycerol uptake facilitator protein